VADLASKLDVIVEQIESARAMPLSSSCVVNRTELLSELSELRSLLPQEVKAAREVIDGRDDVLADARKEAAGIVEEARAERTRLVARTEIVQQAQAEAVRLVEEAKNTSDEMRREVDDYVDGKLANFEVVLQKTLSAVDRGRSKLRGRSDLDALASAEPEDDDLPIA
jgi:predicted metal-dependent peptidase